MKKLGVPSVGMKERAWLSSRVTSTPTIASLGDSPVLLKSIWPLECALL